MNKMNKYILTLVFIAALHVIVRAQAQEYVQDNHVYTGTAEITATRQVTLLPGFTAVRGSNVHVYITDPGSSTGTDYTPDEGDIIAGAVPGNARNYIHTLAPRVGETQVSNLTSVERTETLEYFDGLGRLVQTIGVEAAPGNEDIVGAIGYDAFGRDSIHFLPFVYQNSSPGAYVSDYSGKCATFYSSAVAGREPGSSPWTETLYEPSPLNRVTGEKGPDQWQGKPTNASYQTNTSQISNWSVSGNPDNFPEHELYVTQYTDEDDKVTLEYKDKLGQVVCKAAVNGNETLETHYIYDDFGLLRCVVPPKASGPEDTELCYYYGYDRRKRMTSKKLPGAEITYMVYDVRDRLVLTQDGNLRQKGKWMCTFYDALNRPVLTALVNSPGEFSTVEPAFKEVSYNASFSTGTYFGYNVGLPAIFTSSVQVLTVTYYDNYSFLNNTSYGKDYRFSEYSVPGFQGTASGLTKTLVTGSVTRVIGGDGTITGNDRSQFLASAVYYDDYARPIRTISENHLGTTDVSCSAYNFVGQETLSATVHNYGENDEIKIANRFSYDHQGRLLTEKVEINDNGSPVTIAAYEYNKLGETVAKYLHGDDGGHHFNQKIDYTYNIKGWLRKLNQVNSLGNDLFALDLSYNTPGASNGLTASPQFNGNISEMIWDTGTPKGYGFTYDALNRLKEADYAEGSALNSNNDAFSTTYSYDENGNMAGLTRSMAGNPIDNLTYHYIDDGNRLESVDDASNNSLGYNDAGGMYTYDLNGNLKTDPSKSTFIEYNYLNLPGSVQFDNGNDYIYYTYDAGGNKRTKIVDGTTYTDNNTRVDYCGDFIYENGELKAIFTSAGRIIPVEDNGNVLYKFEYNLQDHLGNTRVVFEGHSNGQPEVVQTTDYYPFGMIMGQQNNFATGVLANKFLYNNKELQDDELAGNSLGWYDYGARFYDPTLARWHSVDPMAEKYYQWSPYNYSINNPIRFVDPDGNGVFDKVIEIGKQWLARKAQQVVTQTAVAVAQATVATAKEEVKNIETGVRVEGEAKLTIGMQAAQEKEGIGGHVNLGSEDILNINGSLEATNKDGVSGEGEIYSKNTEEDRRTTLSTGAAVTVPTEIGLVGVEAEASTTETNKLNGSPTQLRTTTAYTGVGWNGIVGAGVYGTHSTQNGNSSTELGVRVGHGQSKSAFFGVSYDFSVKFFIRHKKE